MTVCSRYGWALSIQPHTGQILAEMTGGIQGRFRHWTKADAERYPEAGRQCTSQEKLVVDRDDNLVYVVSRLEDR